MKFRIILWGITLWLCCHDFFTSRSYAQESNTVSLRYKNDFHFPKDRFAEEQTVATDFLLSKGVAKEKCSLKTIAVNSELVIMEDRDNKLFVMEARRDRHILMPQPILAYSTESRLKDSRKPYPPC